MTMYADDTVITLTDSCPDRIITKLNDVMELISSWCDLNLIGINVFKSKAMAVSNRLITSDLNLKLNSIPLEFVKNFTYLGIKLDSKLKYSEHIEFLKTKLAQLTGIARRVTGYFDLHSAYLYYFSFVYSLINYGISCWGGILFVYKYPELHDAINRLIKIIFKSHVPCYDPITIHSELGLLKIKDVYKLNLMVYYNQLKGDPELNDITFADKQTNYSLRRVDELVIPYPRTNTIKGNFSYLIPLIWNEVPNDIKKIKILRVSKQLIRNSY